MTIIFITLNDSYAEKLRDMGFEANVMKIQDYVPNPYKKTYYVSPANSLCFMDGGIDFALSRIIFTGIEKEVKEIVKQIGIQNIVGKYYLPIGSSIIIDKGTKSLVMSPTMLLPQNVSNTKNAYYATIAALYNILINKKENFNDIDIILTSFCCGYGKMDEDESIAQIIEGINDYKNYTPNIINNNIIINEPNLHEQPKFYQNTEFFPIRPDEIKHC